MDLSNELSCEAGSFFCCCLNPHRCFQSEVLRLISCPGTLGCGSVSVSSCSSWFSHTRMWDLPLPQPPPCQTSQSFSRLAVCSLLPSCLSLPLLLVWVSVSSLTPWLSDSIQFNFLSVLVVFVFKFVVVLLLFVQGGTVCLPTPPSWPTVTLLSLR